MAAYALPTRVKIDASIPEKKTNVNYFCTVKLGEATLRVILYLAEGDPLGHVLLKRCLDADYDCHLVHEESRVIENLNDLRHQTVVLVDVKATTSVPGAALECNNMEHLSQYLQTTGLNQRVGLVGLVKDCNSSQTMERLLQAGVSRILTEEDCRGDRVIWELKMIEKHDISLREKQIFGLALFEAVDQSDDAIQITGKDSHIMYVNRAFLELSGYSIEEVIGQPALDIMKPFDTKVDNGPKAAVKKGQGWDGVCMGRRKSGSILRQHLKMIPVRDSSDSVYHHVTIQRLLSVNDTDNPRICSPKATRGTHDFPFVLKKQPSFGKVLPRLESPLIKAVQMLYTARDSSSTPQDVREILDRAIESLCNSELYRIPVRPSGGLVAGLLQSGPRFSQSPFDFSFMKMAQPHGNLPQNPPIIPPPPEVQVCLKNLDEWEFDIMNLETVSKSRPLYYVGMKVFSQFDICSVLNIEVGVLASWFKLMESHYHSENPYHNSTHAADVLQATAYFVKRLQDTLVLQGDVLDHSEVAALLISAAVHDLDHPARTNPYLCNTRHELAILYNDNAVLENHHVALCYKLTDQSNDVNIFQNLDTAAFRTLRTSIIDLVLATDMAKHFEHLAKFNVLVSVDETGSTTSLTDIVGKESNRENRMIMKKVLVKCADISNPCRPLPLCKVWAQRIAEEYFAQTDDEKLHHLPVVFPDFDRQTCKLPVTQAKFIDYFISALFEGWNTFCPIPTVMDYHKSNYAYWKSQSPNSPNSSSEEEADSSSS